MISLIGLILSPGFVWAWIFYHMHRYKHSHLPLLAWLFSGGFASGMLALVLNHTVEKYTAFWPGAQHPVEELFGLTFSLYSSGFWLMVGVNEEFAKLALLLLAVYHSRHLEEPFDGILYIAVIALGFATVENVFYLEQYGSAVVVTRSIITLPAHAFMSVPMGYFVSKSKLILLKKSEEPSAYFIPLLWIITGWFYSILLHGSYDLMLSLGFEYIAYAMVVSMGIQSIWLGRQALKQSKLSPFQESKKELVKFTSDSS